MQFDIYRAELPNLGETHITVAWSSATPRPHWGSKVDIVNAQTGRDAAQIYFNRAPGLSVEWNGHTRNRRLWCHNQTQTAMIQFSKPTRSDYRITSFCFSRNPEKQSPIHMGILFSFFLDFWLRRAYTTINTISTISTHVPQARMRKAPGEMST